MGKIIKITEEQLEECKNIRMVDGTISFPSTNRKANVIFTPLAYAKTMALVGSFSSEIGWYGVASRVGEDEDDTYLISDVLVYPQSVSGSYIDVDEEKNGKWLFEHLSNGDERMGNLFMQAHSHVNMACSPSPEDVKTMSKLLSTADDDGFLISMIWNKRGEHYCRIFDLRKNYMFENADVTVSVDCGDETLDDFVSESRKLVTTYTYTYKTPTYQSQKATTTPSATTSKPVTTETPKQIASGTDENSHGKGLITPHNDWRKPKDINSMTDEEWEEYQQEWYEQSGKYSPHQYEGV